MLNNNITEEEIIQKISGGDETRGSCSSLALTYIGNKNGLNVLDFRGGESQRFFSTPQNILKMCEVPVSAPGPSNYLPFIFNFVQSLARNTARRLQRL